MRHLRITNPVRIYELRKGVYPALMPEQKLRPTGEFTIVMILLCHVVIMAMLKETGKEVTGNGTYGRLTN